jgi:hypothetical protein
MVDPALIEADNLAGEPGELQAKLGLFGSPTGLIWPHARWIVDPPAGGIVVNLF